MKSRDIAFWIVGIIIVIGLLFLIFRNKETYVGSESNLDADYASDSTDDGDALNEETASYRRKLADDSGKVFYSPYASSGDSIVFGLPTLEKTVGSRTDSIGIVYQYPNGNEEVSNSYAYLVMYEGVVGTDTQTNYIFLGENIKVLEVREDEPLLASEEYRLVVELGLDQAKVAKTEANQKWRKSVSMAVIDGRIDPTSVTFLE